MVKVKVAEITVDDLLTVTTYLRLDYKTDLEIPRFCSLFSAGLATHARCPTGTIDFVWPDWVINQDSVER
jgi:hypothetical protein